MREVWDQSLWARGKWEGGVESMSAGKEDSMTVDSTWGNEGGLGWRLMGGWEMEGRVESMSPGREDSMTADSA
jgi:hypothetical protein